MREFVREEEKCEYIQITQRFTEENIQELNQRRSERELKRSININIKKSVFQFFLHRTALVLEFLFSLRDWANMKSDVKNCKLVGNLQKRS